MKRALFVIVGCIVLQGTGEAAVNTRILNAEILDDRVAKCGVSIGEDSLVTIRPFLESPSGLTGTLKIKVESRSGSNTNVSMQTVSFPGNNVIGIGNPSSIRIEMAAIADGKEVCRLSQDVDFGTTRL
jgi:hypothetical protein